MPLQKCKVHYWKPCRKGRLPLAIPLINLDEPFLVLATQNPLEQEGTYPLPEAQVDRFILKVVVGYPSRIEEQLIMRQNVQGLKTPKVNPVVSIQEILAASELVRQIYLDEKVEQYILDIVFATRISEQFKLEKLKPMISYGGHRHGASINLALAAKAQAFLNNRGYVIPEDVRSICDRCFTPSYRVNLRSRSRKHNRSKCDRADFKNR